MILSEFAFLYSEDESILNYELKSHWSARCLYSVSMQAVSVQAGRLFAYLPLERSHRLMDAVISLGF